METYSERYTHSGRIVRQNVDMMYMIYIYITYIYILRDSIKARKYSSYMSNVPHGQIIHKCLLSNDVSLNLRTAIYFRCATIFLSKLSQDFKIDIKPIQARN